MKPPLGLASSFCLHRIRKLELSGQMIEESENVKVQGLRVFEKKLYFNEQLKNKLTKKFFFPNFFKLKVLIIFRTFYIKSIFRGRATRAGSIFDKFSCRFLAISVKSTIDIKYKISAPPGSNKFTFFLQPPAFQNTA